jgi:hypothetical protein
MENRIEVPQRLKILPYDPAILGYNPKETKSTYQRDAYMPMFIAALLTVIKIWNQ